MLSNEKWLLSIKKRFVYKEKGFAHTEKKCAYIHKTNPQQIATANSPSKKATKNCFGKFPRQIAITNICQGVPTMLLLKNLIIKASFIF